MAVSSSGVSAQIFEFPIGGRKFGRRRFEQSGTIAEFKPKPVMVLDYSNWYHEEAMREEQTPKS
ncbi:DUF2735 domain-containing protein [Rhizobium sp. 32-5/1]|uniref:DUF2735 domain-containing protein n=1 Tax=Rhizobium sp. 32-5/1 TaxID=3019602 RepID=UPI00240CEC10|nr:DUF2735 domain-containing protein [Rhizobium sp. 32-5/1]WEZ84520.1 DUF2735 domain-containing protein [Rhizobium sp. 32-5/1]